MNKIFKTIAILALVGVSTCLRKTSWGTDSSTTNGQNFLNGNAVAVSTLGVGGNLGQVGLANIVYNPAIASSQYVNTGRDLNGGGNTFKTNVGNANILSYVN